MSGHTLLEVANSWLEANARGSLAKSTSLMSGAYRGGATSQALSGDFRAYLAARLPATYAAVKACLDELKLRCPGFSPTSFCDAGAGPGTASWAAVEAWPQLERVTLRDSDAAFLKLAGTLAAESGSVALRQAQQSHARISDPFENSHDLVVASYVFAELPPAGAGRAAENLWRAAAQALVIVEPGTPAGFANIRAARMRLIELGAHIAAPCVHDNACPMQMPDWCHFSVRLARSRVHMHAKRARVPFEDEKYAYVIATRSPVTHQGARILARPVESKAEMRFKLCGTNGLEAAAVAARNRAEFKRVKKLSWGSLFS
jgi:ribosomal protein RSM22 (predicted rRNA methylase)